MYNLSETQKAVILGYAESDMTARATAKKVFVHESVVRYHIRQIKKKTGKDMRKFYDLVELVEMVKGTPITSEAKQEADRKKLRELICYGLLSCDSAELADFLVDNGVIFQKHEE